MATVAQIRANRANAQRSTGPKTADGKAVVGANALRMGLRSARLFVEGEDPQEFQALCADLDAALRPVGAVEIALAERIAVALWRQRRLVKAEAAAIDLERRPAEIARDVKRTQRGALGESIASDNLQPFDEEEASWCPDVLVEIDGLEEISLATLAQRAPLVHAQLLSDAAGEDEDPATHVSSLENGLTTYVADLATSCRKQLTEAEQRPQVLALAEQLRARRLVLPVPQLEAIARYQTTLDNQLYKALRAFRDAQEWRLKTLDSVPESEGSPSVIERA
jgi:hypothetical protein